MRNGAFAARAEDCLDAVSGRGKTGLLAATADGEGSFGAAAAGGEAVLIGFGTDFGAGFGAGLGVGLSVAAAAVVAAAFLAGG